MWMLMAAALAAKVPVKVNIGFGPSVGTVTDPTAGVPVSAGLALSLEAWVSKKTLRSKAVRRSVPKQYRGMVKQMDDLHVRPVYTWVVPDAVLVGPGPVGAFWSPISVYLAHTVKPSHRTLALAPRVGFVGLEQPVGWIGVTLTGEVQSAMAKKVGWSAGFDVGPGYAGLVDGHRPWLYGTASAKLHVRIPIKVNL